MTKRRPENGNLFNELETKRDGRCEACGVEIVFVRAEKSGEWCPLDVGVRQAWTGNPTATCALPSSFEAEGEPQAALVTFVRGDGVVDVTTFRRGRDPRPCSGLTYSSRGGAGTWRHISDAVDLGVLDPDREPPRPAVDPRPGVAQPGTAP